MGVSILLPDVSLVVKQLRKNIKVFSNCQNRTRINILSLNDLPEIHPLGCFESRLQTKICVKKEDEYVSRNMQDRVTLVHNAVSDKHDTVYPVIFNADPLKNPGSLRVAPETEVLTLDTKPLGPGVESVTLPDILETISARSVIIKMDIQGQECKALLAPGVFDTGHFIPYIFMEWDIISAGHKFCTNITALITLLKSRDYFPINLDPLGKLSDVCLQKQMQDMVWMHKNAHPLWEGDHVFYECEPYS